MKFFQEKEKLNNSGYRAQNRDVLAPAGSVRRIWPDLGPQINQN